MMNLMAFAIGFIKDKCSYQAEESEEVKTEPKIICLPNYS